MKNKQLLTLAILLLCVTAGADVTYEKDLKPILKDRCAMCHNESTPEMNWMDYKTALKKKDSIKKRLTDKTMPPANITNLTEDEKKMIIKWVDEGGKK